MTAESFFEESELYAAYKASPLRGVFAEGGKRLEIRTPRLHVTPPIGVVVTGLRGRRAQLMVYSNHWNAPLPAGVRVRLTFWLGMDAKLKVRVRLPARPARGPDVRVVTLSAEAARRLRQLSPNLPVGHVRHL